MAAGLGYIEFNTGDVLTAAQANGYLASQVVMVFASSAARTSAVTSPQEGMFSYLKDTDATEYYSGSAWVGVSNPGDITAVTAGTGISGGGTSGAVTITNSMATAITTAGDLIRGTGSGTFERLGVGSTGQVLTVSGGTPTWATPAGGGKVLQVVSQAYTTATTTTSTSFVDTGVTQNITPSLSTSKVLVTVTIPYFCTSATTATAGGKFAIYRGATEIGGYSGANNVYITATTGTEVDGTWSITFLDSPATTSATTYKVRFLTRASTTTLGISTSSMASTITLMEIGA
jgi:hypothetical protein